MLAPRNWDTRRGASTEGLSTRAPTLGGGMPGVTPNVGPAVRRLTPGLALDLSADLVDNSMFHRFSGGADGVGDRPAVGPPVADDADPIDAQERRAAVLRIVGSPLHAPQYRRQQRRR